MKLAYFAAGFLALTLACTPPAAQLSPLDPDTPPTDLPGDPEPPLPDEGGVAVVQPSLHFIRASSLYRDKESPARLERNFELKLGLGSQPVKSVTVLVQVKNAAGQWQDLSAWRDRPAEPGFEIWKATQQGLAEDLAPLSTEFRLKALVNDTVLVVDQAGQGFALPAHAGSQLADTIAVLQVFTWASQNLDDQSTWIHGSLEAGPGHDHSAVGIRFTLDGGETWQWLAARPADAWWNDGCEPILSPNSFGTAIYTWNLVVSPDDYAGLRYAVSVQRDGKTCLDDNGGRYYRASDLPVWN